MDYAVSVADFVQTFIGLAGSEGRRATFVQIGAGRRLSFNPFGPFLDRLTGYIVDPLLEIEDKRFTTVRAAILPTPGRATLFTLNEAAIDQGLLPEGWRSFQSFTMHDMLRPGGWLAAACPSPDALAAIGQLMQETSVPAMRLSDLVDFYDIGATDMLAISTCGAELSILDQLHELPSLPRGLLIDITFLLPEDRRQTTAMLVDRGYYTAAIDNSLVAAYYDQRRALRKYVPALRTLSQALREKSLEASGLLDMCVQDLDWRSQAEQLADIVELIREGAVDKLLVAFNNLWRISGDRDRIRETLLPLAADLQALAQSLTAGGSHDVAVDVLLLLSDIGIGSAQTRELILLKYICTDLTGLAARCAHDVLKERPDSPVALHVAINFASHIGDIDREYSLRERLLDCGDTVQSLVQMHNCIQIPSLCLRSHLTPQTIAVVTRCQEKARHIPFPDRQASEFQPVYRHYRALLDALDIDRPDPDQLVGGLRDMVIFNHSGRLGDLSDVSRVAAARGARTVLLVAADRHYLRRYARLFIRSALANQDEEIIILVHAIGGRTEIADITAEIGIQVDNLFYSADDFDSAPHYHTSIDKGGIVEKPIAHYQCARFEIAASLSAKLMLNVIVADIDTLVLQGTLPLTIQHQGRDIVLNANRHAVNFGALITANLLLIRPTPAAARFMAILLTYLRRELMKPIVTRWVDQIGLLLARRRCERGPQPINIGQFREDDINNTMFNRFTDPPFRFLSLYAHFDLDTIPDIYR